MASNLQYKPITDIPNRRFMSTSAAVIVTQAILNSAQDGSLMPKRLTSQHRENATSTTAALYERMITDKVLRSALYKMIMEANILSE